VTATGRRIEAEGSGTVEAAVERFIRRTPRARLEAARDVLVALADSLTAPA
jgi:hypothetical protein